MTGSFLTDEDDSVPSELIEAELVDLRRRVNDVADEELSILGRLAAVENRVRALEQNAEPATTDNVRALLEATKLFRAAVKSGDARQYDKANATLCVAVGALLTERNCYRAALVHAARSNGWGQRWIVMRDGLEVVGTGVLLPGDEVLDDAGEES